MSPRPGRIADIIDVPLGADRSDGTVRPVASSRRSPRSARRSAGPSSACGARGVEDRISAARPVRPGPHGPPVVFGALLLGLWQFVVRYFDLKPYFLVAPTDIYRALVDNWSNIWEAMLVSGTTAVFGLLFGVLAGMLMSFLLSRFRITDELIMPMSIAVNTIPAFVLVSVFNNMWSTTSEVPRRLMVTLVVFFVVLVSVAKGLRQGRAGARRADAQLCGRRLGRAAQGAGAQQDAVPS